ncbi:MAG TPA: hypothetical protein VG502_11675 [Flexivirga sp.]|uniref:hypothetical protein n=1 Tax=Flexivirga sp. TaxID=1962927 RepID=UPI002D10A1AC|nr:hypothetical protein [Flexivirga sp.]HWC22951.1 hypothetical protein [Flexivirga sp.]
MNRTLATTAAVFTAMSLAACGSSGSSAAGGSTSSTATTTASTATTTSGTSHATPASSATSPTPTPQLTTASTAQKWASSLCSKIDVNKVAKVVDSQVVVPQKQVTSSDVGYVTFDTCQYALQGADRWAGQASYGISADTWTTAEWDAQLHHDLTDNDTDKAVTVGGHHGMASKVTGYLLVGNRVVQVVGGTGSTREQMVGLLKLAVPAAPSVKPWPALLGVPQCNKGNAAAAAAIGGPATIRRDDADGSLMCGWAAHRASVSVYGMPAEDSATMVTDEAARVPKSQKIKGLGLAAVYFPNGELHVATKKSKVTVTGTGEHVTKGKLVALTKVMLADF